MRFQMALCGLALFMAGSASAGETLRLLNHSADDVVVDLGAKGDSVGDLMSFSEPVFDWDNTVQLGLQEGLCVRTVVGKHWYCQWVYTVPEGALTVQGVYNDTGDSQYVVTGGAGKYLGARGVVKAHLRDAEKSYWELIYELQ